MSKVFDYAVIYDGVYYPANTPIEEKKPKKAVAKKNDKGTSGTTENSDK